MLEQPRGYLPESGEGNWESEAPGRRGGGLDWLVIESPRRGVCFFLEMGWGRARGREGVCGEFGGGGVDIFFRARK